MSLMERLVDLYDSAVARQLTVQYRMHEQIMRFSSEEFYQSSLIAHASVEQHRLSDLPGVKSNKMTDTPLAFIDTAGAGYDEQLEPDGESRFNPHEALCVQNQVRALLDSGVAPTDIAVITPYAAQVRHLREQLLPWGIDVDTVDGFQGREKEAVDHFPGPVQLAGGNRFSGRHTPHQRRADPRPPQTHCHRRQCDNRCSSVLSAVARVLRTAERLSHRVGDWGSSS